MKIGANGIVINERGQVLLIQRDDTRTFAPPGGGLDMGELPTTAVAREVKEETGLIVHPVRLVGVYFWHTGSESYLMFSFRCIKRGGEITPSPESPRVGYVNYQELPRQMARFHRQRIQHGVTHTAPAPVLSISHTGWQEKLGRLALRYAIYPFKDLQRKWHQQPAYVPPPEWKTGAFAVIRNEAGAVLWVQRADNGLWNLPGGVGYEHEAPWQTAVRETHEETGLTVQVIALTSVNVYEEEPNLTCTFTATILGGELTTGAESAQFAYFQPGEEPPNTVQQHIERVAHTVNDNPHTQFSVQTAKVAGG